MSLLLLFPSSGPGIASTTFCWHDTTSGTGNWSLYDYDFKNLWGNWSSYTWGQIGA